jgi:hypothetical protein
MGTNEAYL